MSTFSITIADRRTLESAIRIEERHDAGIFPRGGSQRRHFVKLVERGLLRFEGWGRDIDAEGFEGRDVMIYRITDAGRAIAAERRHP